MERSAPSTCSSAPRPLTMVVSSAACALAVSMLVATSDADDDPTEQLGYTVLGMAVCGGLIPLRRVSRPRVEPRPVWVAVRCLVAGGSVGGAVYGCLQLKDPGDSLTASMGLVILVALMTPWLIPALDQWTRLCGIAGANVRVRRRFSVPHIVPWVLLGGLIVAVGSGVMMLKGTESLDTLSSGRVFAAFLGPVVAPSIVGVVLTSLIMRSRIANDVRGLRLSAASPAAWARVQVGEACCLTVTAALIIIALSAKVVMLLNQLLHSDSPSGMSALWEGLAGVWWAPFGLIFGAMFLALCAVKLILAGFLRSTAQIRTN
ncbi:ABC transporter permease [Corynebacterium macginleyi]|nr:ABC transporter permease [Corynebacterium macginleyi]